MSVTQGVGAMSEAEVVEFIKNSRCGVLTFVDGDRPYGVPVEHFFDGKSLYFLTSPKMGQRKMACIEKNPNACFIISDSRREKPELVKKGIRCRSVIIEGRIGAPEIKEIESKEFGKVKVRVIRLDVEKIGNWVCPRKTCDWPTAWFERYPNVVGCA